MSQNVPTHHNNHSRRGKLLHTSVPLIHPTKMPWNLTYQGATWWSIFKERGSKLTIDNLQLFVEKFTMQSLSAPHISFNTLAPPSSTYSSYTKVRLNWSKAFNKGLVSLIYMNGWEVLLVSMQQFFLTQLLVRNTTHLLGWVPWDHVQGKQNYPLFPRFIVYREHSGHVWQSSQQIAILY